MSLPPRRAKRLLGPLSVLCLISLLVPPLASAAPDLRELRSRAQRSGSVRVLVELDVPTAPEASLRSRALRRAQRRAIARGQQRLLSELSRADRRRVRRFRRIRWLALEATPRALERLERSTWVRRVEEDRLHAPFLPESIPLLGADLAAASGFDGAGRAVAVLDTGVDTGHEFLASSVVAEACFSAGSSCPNGQRQQIGSGAGIPCSYADGCFHGTHVAGIAVGSGPVSFSGVAPAASLVAVQVFSRLTGDSCSEQNEDPCALAYTSDILAGLEHVLELSQTLPIDAVNLSLGFGSFSSQSTCDLLNPSLLAAVDDLRAAGVAAVVSSGNEGRIDAISVPACLSSALAVGASDDADVVAGFSNSAPFLAFLAPGVEIASSVPEALLGFPYGVTGGTSMAAPHVAGAFAVLRQASPGASVDELVALLASTGLPILDLKSGVTTPRIDVAAALEALPAAGPLACAPGPDSDADGVPDACDSCSAVANAEQIDTDGDGYGNACDADFTGDGVIGGPDFSIFLARLGTSCGEPGYDPLVDLNGDCTIGGADFSLLLPLLGGPPGPSGLAP